MRYVGVGNYTRVLADAGLWRSIKNSLTFGLGSLAGSIPVGFGLALLLNQVGRLKGPLRVLILTPWVMSQAVVGILWMWLLNPAYGPVARLADLLGLPKLLFLSSPDLAMPTLIAITIRWSYPFPMVLIPGALQTVPRELYEAVIVDGGSRWVSFRYVTVPFIRNTVASAGIVLVLHYLNMVTLILVTTAGGPLSRTETFSLRIFLDMFVRYRLSDALVQRRRAPAASVRPRGRRAAGAGPTPSAPPVSGTRLSGGTRRSRASRSSDDLRAFAGEKQRGSSTNPGAGTEYDRYFVLKSQH